MSQLTLHEAMVVILRRDGGGWMSRDDMARGIDADKLLLRPSDGQPPPSELSTLRNAGIDPAHGGTQPNNEDTQTDNTNKK